MSDPKPQTFEKWLATTLTEAVAEPVWHAAQTALRAEMKQEKAVAVAREKALRESLEKFGDEFERECNRRLLDVAMTIRLSTWLRSQLRAILEETR